MARRETVMTAAVTVVAALLAVSYAAGPSSGDWRYPQYIVKPKVNCPSEGVFPHPRNCSWYYRCVDRMKLGFYHKYYFECEPGTVFSDDLDQCVFPFATGPPCGTGTGKPPTQTLPPVITPTPTTEATTTKPKTEPPTRPPTAPPTVVTEPPSPVPETTTSNIIAVPCTFLDSNCQQVEYCTPQRVIRNLCTTCNIGTAVISTEVFCRGTNKVFDKDLNSCVDLPPESSLCPTTTTPVPENVPFQNNNTFTCSHDKRIPDEPWIRKTFCKSQALCDEGFYKGQKQVCTNYYQCTLTPEDTWTYSIESCSVLGEHYYYSFEENSCITLLPSETC